MKHDFKPIPDRKYRFTAIAPTAQSLTYHGQRQWFKTAKECEAFCIEVFTKEHPRTFDLAIVEAKQVISPKPQRVAVNKKVLRA